jgi:hypothetical protein
MKKIFIILSICFCALFANAQTTEKQIPFPPPPPPPVHPLFIIPPAPPEPSHPLLLKKPPAVIKIKYAKPPKPAEPPIPLTPTPPPPKKTKEIVIT